MYVYGGCKASGEENQTIFMLNIKSLTWSELVIVSNFSFYFITFIVETWSKQIYSIKPR